MSSSIDRSAMIAYPPEALVDFTVTGYEWIDNLNFVMDPAQCLDDADRYVAVARDRFTRAGRSGDGSIGLIWVHPFALPQERQIGNAS